MGWGSEFQDPAEKRAAQEAAEAMAAQRAAEDARNDMLAGAIVQGAALLADAVLAAAGIASEERDKVLARAGIADPGPYTGPLDNSISAMQAYDDDILGMGNGDDMDDLLASDECSCEETAPEWCPTHGTAGHGLPDTDCGIGTPT
jgi:hypothetical protein